MIVLRSVCAIGIAVLIAVGCSSASTPEATNTAIVVSTATPIEADIDLELDPEPTSFATKIPALSEPSVSAEPTATVTVAPVVELPDLDISQLLIGDCRISGVLSESGFSGQGTAPAPTPSPVPAEITRPRQVVRGEVAELSRRIAPVINALITYDTAFKSGWPFARTAENQAAQLYVFGNRLSQLCSAISQPNVPPEVFGEVAGLSEAVRVRHAWVVAAAAELTCCGTAQTAELLTGFDSTSFAVDNATALLVTEIDNWNVFDNADRFDQVAIDRFGLVLELEEGALLVRNGIDVLITFLDGSELLDPMSLGPSPWIDGTALRVRRLRNSSEFTAIEASVEHSGVLNRYGDVGDPQAMSIGNLGSIWFSHPPKEDLWEGATIIYVADGFTYFFEMMCQRGAGDQCDSVNSLIESILGSA